MARIRISVSFDLPEGCDRDRALSYVHDAVTAWAGSLRPAGAYGDDDEGDPMRYLDRDSVDCSYATTSNNKRKIVRIHE